MSIDPTPTSPGALRRMLTVVLRLLVALSLAMTTAWAACAIGFQIAAPHVKYPLLVLWGLVGLLCIVFVLRQRPPLWAKWCGLAYTAILLLLLGWWHSIEPSHHRLWADDVTQLLESQIDGDIVTLRNVRNFEWRSETDYDAHWEERRYRLSQLESADLFLSYWMGPHIAHTLVSFGFSDGQRLVFSLEIRKERHESFSAVGGFFREFEQVLIAADERDIIRTRSNARGEDVYLYSLNLSQPILRELFLGYLQEAERLRQAPSFYNTLTSNCTTIVFDLARQIEPGLPADYRLLLSGHFAEYAYDHGALAADYDYQTLNSAGHINPRALAIGPEDARFSHAIREGVPRTAYRDGP